MVLRNSHLAEKMREHEVNTKGILNAPLILIKGLKKVRQENMMQVGQAQKFQLASDNPKQNFEI